MLIKAVIWEEKPDLSVACSVKWLFHIITESSVSCSVLLFQTFFKILHNSLLTVKIVKVFTHTRLQQNVSHAVTPTNIPHQQLRLK